MTVPGENRWRDEDTARLCPELVRCCVRKFSPRGDELGWTRAEAVAKLPSRARLLSPGFLFALDVPRTLAKME